MSQYSAVWKSFEANEITHSMAHYLLALANLEDGAEQNEVKAADLARALNVSRSAVSLKLKSLRDQGWIETEPTLKLTPVGRELTQRIQSKRKIVMTLLLDLLGVQAEKATEDACKIEHLLSDESAFAMVSLLSFCQSGHPAVKPFLDAFAEFGFEGCEEKRCSICAQDCVTDALLGSSS